MVEGLWKVEGESGEPGVKGKVNKKQKQTEKLERTRGKTRARSRKEGECVENQWEEVERDRES